MISNLVITCLLQKEIHLTFDLIIVQLGGKNDFEVLNEVIKRKTNFQILTKTQKDGKCTTSVEVTDVCLFEETASTEIESQLGAFAKTFKFIKNISKLVEDFVSGKHFELKLF